MANSQLDPSSAQTSRVKNEKSVAASHSAGAMSPVPTTSANQERPRAPRKLVLCFDGTGNKFNGDDSDSNILKIFRLLDQSAENQFHYYQPGIGTYVVSGSLSQVGFRARLSTWYQKAKASAIGSSFDHHVVAGYRFLMKFYNAGDEIYMFGFSRGAYIARFLAEMLDYIGLLSHGNEEMVKFAWRAFAQWQGRQYCPTSGGEKEKKAEEEAQQLDNFMKAFRETFSRPVGRIRFLGLFDTVNSVPRFEAAWMQRSEFPYTARSSAKVIRHAVSIDERRAKFRQDLMYQRRPTARVQLQQQHHNQQCKQRHLVDEAPAQPRRSKEANRPATSVRERSPSVKGKERRPSQLLLPDDDAKSQHSTSSRPGYAPYRSRPQSRQGGGAGDGADAVSVASASGAYQSRSDAGMESDQEEQDIDEVWFAGGHGDVGGGWEALDDRKSTSHIPLAWMVREAMKAGLPFDMQRVAEMGCLRESIYRLEKRDRADIQSVSENPHIRIGDGNMDEQEGSSDSQESSDGDTESDFHKLMHHACTSRIHDSLMYGGGLRFITVMAWNLMEYLPFRRMDLQEDGSWAPIRWPLPRGEVRDIPDNVRVHGSVIRRMKEDESYRPGNLIVGGGGRGIRRAPPEYGIGEWVCVAEPGDPIGEIWMKKGAKDPLSGANV